MGLCVVHRGPGCTNFVLSPTSGTESRLGRGSGKGEEHCSPFSITPGRMKGRCVSVCRSRGLILHRVVVLAALLLASLTSSMLFVLLCGCAVSLFECTSPLSYLPCCWCRVGFDLLCRCCYFGLFFWCIAKRFFWWCRGVLAFGFVCILWCALP